MSRRTVVDRPYIGTNLERVVGDVFRQRSRNHSSWGDVAETVILALEAEGLLHLYSEPGIDPLATIQAFNTDAERE